MAHAASARGPAELPVTRHARVGAGQSLRSVRRLERHPRGGEGPQRGVVKNAPRDNRRIGFAPARPHETIRTAVLAADLAAHLEAGPVTRSS
jgi:hypothetical protein